MDFKQVIVVRVDLKMSSGKTAAQVAHASHSAGELARKKYDNWYRAWLDEGQKKVVLKIDDESQIRVLYQKAKESDLPCYIVNDAGLTELPPGTTTTLGIGPAPESEINRITGDLKLL